METKKLVTMKLPLSLIDRYQIASTALHMSLSEFFESAINSYMESRSKDISASLEESIRGFTGMQQNGENNNG
jgi:hypothetical protein